MGGYARWLGVALFFCGAVTFIVAMIFFTVSSSARTRALMMGAFQTRADYTAKGWRLYVTGVALAVLGFVLAAVAEFGFLRNF
jgi:hypothetical protein